MMFRPLQGFGRRFFSSTLKQKPNRSAIFPNDLEHFDHLSANILPKVRDFIIKNSDENVPICNHKPFEELKSMLTHNGALPDDAISDDELMNEIDLLLNYSPRCGKPRYVDKLFCGSDSIVQFAAYLLSVLNNNCHTYHSSQILTLIENVTIKNLCNVFFKQNESPYGGVFLPGGAYSNCVAYRLARDKYFPSIATDGLSSNGPTPVALASDQAHYSVMTSIKQLGIGTNNVIKLETHNDGTINIEKCDQTISDLIKQNKKPFVLSCNAGTTVLGAFDDFKQISAICKKYDIWMHVDGCWGGSAAFVQDQYPLTDGIELADSISFDSHKLLSTGLLCGCLLVSDEKYLYESCEPPNAKYLFHGDDDEINHDIGLKTLQCGRQCDAIKLYFSWLYYGKKGLSQRVENGMNNASYLVELIKQSDDFILVQEPKFCNVCFWYIGNMKHAKEFDLNLNDQNVTNTLETNTKRIYSILEKESNSMVDYSPCKGLPSFFRMITSNYRLNQDNIDIVLNDIRSAAKLL